jgi:hypothetical protein
VIFIARICRIAFDCLGAIHREWPGISDQTWVSFLWAYFKTLRKWAVRELDSTHGIYPNENWA